MYVTWADQTSGKSGIKILRESILVQKIVLAFSPLVNFNMLWQT